MFNSYSCIFVDLDNGLLLNELHANVYTNGDRTQWCFNARKRVNVLMKQLNL